MSFVTNAIQWIMSKVLKISKSFTVTTVEDGVNGKTTPVLLFSHGSLQYPAYMDNSCKKETVLSCSCHMIIGETYCSVVRLRSVTAPSGVTSAFSPTNNSFTITVPEGYSSSGEVIVEAMGVLNQTDEYTTTGVIRLEPQTGRSSEVKDIIEFHNDDEFDTATIADDCNDIIYVKSDVTDGSQRYLELPVYDNSTDRVIQIYYDAIDNNAPLIIKVNSAEGINNSIIQELQASGTSSTYRYSIPIKGASKMSFYCASSWPKKDDVHSIWLLLEKEKSYSYRDTLSDDYDLAGTPTSFYLHNDCGDIVIIRQLSSQDVNTTAYLPRIAPSKGRLIKVIYEGTATGANVLTFKVSTYDYNQTAMEVIGGNRILTSYQINSGEEILFYADDGMWLIVEHHKCISTT